MPAGETLADDLRRHAEVGGTAGAAEVRDVAGEVVSGRAGAGDGVRGGNGGITGGGIRAGLAPTEWEGGKKVGGENGRLRMPIVEEGHGDGCALRRVLSGYR